MAISPLGIEIAFKYSNKFLSEFNGINIMETQLYLIFKDFTYIMILLLAGLSLFFIFKEKDTIKKSLTSLVIYFAGFISRFVMAFSPTVYASQERTSFFWYISICMLIVYLANELDMKNDLK